MSLFIHVVRMFRDCLPAWLSTAPIHEESTASTAMRKEREGKRSLTKDERLEVLKRALAEEYYCAGHPPFDVTGHKLMDCGCPEGTHGPLVVSERGQMYYPA